MLMSLLGLGDLQHPQTSTNTWHFSDHAMNYQACPPTHNTHNVPCTHIPVYLASMHTHMSIDMCGALARYQMW
jgi:hypothetical protein